LLLAVEVEVVLLVVEVLLEVVPLVVLLVVVVLLAVLQLLVLQLQLQLAQVTKDQTPSKSVEEVTNAQLVERLSTPMKKLELVDLHGIRVA